MPIIRCIAAVDDKLGIGRAGKLAWDLPADRKYFREHIENSTVLMGWKTYASLGHKTFPNAKNIILSRTVEGCKDAQIVDELKKFLHKNTDDVWVIGGGQIFAELLPFANELYITRVIGDYDCDVFFPEFETEFHLIKESKPKTENNITYTHQEWERNY